MKSRLRDPRALLYGTYQLVDPHTNMIEVYGSQSGYGLTLDQVKAALNEGR